MGATILQVDLARPLSLAAPVRFDGSGPRAFGAPPPSSVPLSLEGFVGEVAAGGSCNCRTLTLTPHCHGTHTECVSHLTREALDAWQVVPSAPLCAWLASVPAQPAQTTRESTDPAPQPADLLITRERLEAAWPLEAPPVRALILRTLSSEPAPLPPYLSREAAQLIVERRIEHLVVDVPSLDRLADAGRLTAHRVFFGLPQGAHELARATRATCTVTELARIPEDATDGAYLLSLQVPAIGGDAVPSRPLIYPLLA